MHYCLMCQTLITYENFITIFNSGFKHIENQIYQVGICSRHTNNANKKENLFKVLHPISN